MIMNARFWGKLLIILGFVSRIGAAELMDLDPKINHMYQHRDILILPDALDDVIKNQNVVVLDAREKTEYDVSHIQGAMYIGYKKFSLKKLESISKDQMIVVYCSLGVRSERISQKLIKSGYRNVHNLYGGIFHWLNLGYPIVQDEKMTPQIHGYSSSWSKYLKKGRIVL